MSNRKYKRGQVLESLEREVWKSVEGWDNYMISNLGRLKGIRRLNGKGVISYGEFLVGYTNKKGYVIARLYDSTKKITTPIHRLVAKHFNMKPSGATEIHHLDGDKKNNKSDNLMWVNKRTHVAITLKETKFGDGVTGEKHGMSKISASSVLKIREEYTGKYGNVVWLSKKYNITKTHIHRIVKNRAWQSL